MIQANAGKTYGTNTTQSQRQENSSSHGRLIAKALVYYCMQTETEEFAGCYWDWMNGKDSLYMQFVRCILS